MKWLCISDCSLSSRKFQKVVTTNRNRGREGTLRTFNLKKKKKKSIHFLPPEGNVALSYKEMLVKKKVVNINCCNKNPLTKEYHLLIVYLRIDWYYDLLLHLIFF